MENNQPEGIRNLLVPQIITFAFIVSIAVLCFVGTMAVNSGKTGESNPALEFLPYLGVVEVLLAGWISKLIFRATLKERRYADADFHNYYQPYFPALLVGHAFRESAVILGFVYALQGGDLNWLYTLAALAAAFMALAWPTDQKIKQLVDSL